MASTDDLKSIVNRMIMDVIEAKGMATELERAGVLKRQSTSDFYQIHGYLQFALGNIASAEIADRKAKADRPGTLLAEHPDMQRSGRVAGGAA